MSDGGLPDSASIEGLRASIEGLRDHLRTPTPMSGIVLMTPRETAEHLRCSERKLERHRLVGDGPPYVKIGMAIRYPVCKLEKWLAKRMQRSTSKRGVSHQPRMAQRTPTDPAHTTAT